MTESWTPRIVVAVLLGGVLFWLARETDRLGTPGWWTFDLVAVALLALLLSHGRAGLIWTGIFVGTALIVLSAAVLVPRHDQYDQLADRLLGHGLLAPVFLGVWLLLLVAMVIVVAGRSHLSHLVIAVALAAATPVLGTAVAGPVHAVQAEIIADHTTADHARVTGTTTDGPAGPLREQWTVRDPNVTGVVVVGDTVITAQTKGIVALDAATGAERWRYLLPAQEYWPGAVVSPSTGVVAFALDGVVVLLDIGSGKQVGLVALPATDEAWTPVAGGVLSASGQLAMFKSSNVVAVDLDRFTVRVIDEHVLEGCRYTLAGEFDQYLFRSNCGPTVIRAFHDGALRSELTVPAAGGLDCASVECSVRSPIATPGRLTFVQASHVGYEILSVGQWPYVDWRKFYLDSPTLFPVIESADKIVTTFVVQFLSKPNWTAMFSFSGLVVPTPTVADADLAAVGRLYAATGPTVTSIDTTTWQTVSTTNVGCEVSQLSAGQRLVVAMCGSGKLVGLAE